MGTRKSSRLAQKTFLFRWPKLLFYGSPAVAPRGVWVMLCATCCMVLCVCEWICGTAGHCTCVRDACVTVCLWVCGSFIAQSAGALFCEFSTEFRPFPTGFPSRIFVFADSFDLVSTRDCDCMRNWWPANSWHLFICPASRPKTNNKYLAVGMAMQVLFFPYFVPRPHGFIHNNFHAAAVAFLCTTFKFIMSTFTHTAIHVQTHTHSHWGKAANADSVKAFSWQVWGPRSPRHEIPGFLCAAGGSRFLLSHALPWRCIYILAGEIYSCCFPRSSAWWAIFLPPFFSSCYCNNCSASASGSGLNFSSFPRCSPFVMQFLWGDQMETSCLQRKLPLKGKSGWVLQHS